MCENVECSVQTAYQYEWVDLSGSQMDDVTRIANGEWEQNDDDGWYHVNLPFDFNWFGTLERTITIGTNGDTHNELAINGGNTMLGTSLLIPATVAQVSSHSAPASCLTATASRVLAGKLPCPSQCEPSEPPIRRRT